MIYCDGTERCHSNKGLVEHLWLKSVFSEKHWRLKKDSLCGWERRVIVGNCTCICRLNEWIWKLKLYLLFKRHTNFYKISLYRLSYKMSWTCQNWAHVGVRKMIWQSSVLLNFIYSPQITGHIVKDSLQHLTFELVFSTLCLLIWLACNGCSLRFCIALLH